MNFKEYINSKGEVIYYIGNPNMEILENVSKGYGDIWHSSFEQGFKNAFSDIKYFSIVFFWYVDDFDNLDECVSWRLNPDLFAIRKEVWDYLPKFDGDITNKNLQALDFAYNALKNYKVVPLYVKGLYDDKYIADLNFTTKDRYVFYRKNYKKDHLYYMLFRKGFWNVKEWDALLYAMKNFTQRSVQSPYPAKELEPMVGKPTVSYIIPTMLRQNFTLQLLEDLKNQTYLPSQVLVVDATPPEKRNEELYNAASYPFEVVFKWQTTKGSSRARNEAIELCKGDYIIFGDDDIRLPEYFIENHIRFLQTYKVAASNGLDIRADHQQQDLTDLKNKLEAMGTNRWYAGATNSFSNANSCVKREYVNQLVGNDINFDGGYGEDSDFGKSLTNMGVVVLHNAFSPILHLKPPLGGYRFWGNQAKIIGKKRKRQPWELDVPVKFIRPVPSPTVMYGIYKDQSHLQKEYKIRYFVNYLINGGSKWGILWRLIKLPYRILQFNKSEFYAQNLIKLGKRTS